MHDHGHHHHHHHGHAHGRGPANHANHSAASADDRSVANLRLAFAINLVFTIIEIVGGILTGSLAITADAVHDLGDSLSLGLAWWLARLSGRPADSTYSYGYARLSLLGAVVTGLVLIGGSVAVSYHAVQSLLSGEPPTPYAPGMIGLAALGIAVNGFAAWRLHRDTSMNARMVTWHLLEDVLGWAVVAVAAIVILFWPEAGILDPILSAIIALWILYNVARNLRATGAIFLQAAPEGADLDGLDRAVSAMPGVRSTHHAHAWSLDGSYHILTMHIVIDDAISRDDMIGLKQRVKACAAEHGFDHTTIELEFGDEPCDMRPGETEPQSSAEAGG